MSATPQLQSRRPERVAVTTKPRPDASPVPFRFSSEVDHLLALALERADERNTPAHARLILNGVRLNQVAMRAISLGASFSSDAPLTPAPLCDLLGMGHRRFTLLWNALLLCGALVPMPLDPDQQDELRDEVREKYQQVSVTSDPVTAVVGLWRQRFGIVVNPELAQLLREEASAQ